MPTTVFPALDAAALAVTPLPEVTTDSPAERAWVPSTPRGKAGEQGSPREMGARRALHPPTGANSPTIR